MYEQTFRILLLSFVCVLIFPAHGQLGYLEVTDSHSFLPYEGAPTYGSGASIIDFDSDGDLDIYLLSNEHSENMLYVNNDGSFELEEGALSITMRSRTAIWFDFNGDHLLDVFVAGDCAGRTDWSCEDRENLRLFKQLPDGTFLDVSEETGILSGKYNPGVFGGAAATDVNNDGFLDLLICYWGGDAMLFLNDSGNSFSDITIAAGIHDPDRYWQPLAMDLTNDGFPELYLAVDNSPNLLWENNQDHTFTNASASSGLANPYNDMGLSLGDFDNDQDYDIYVSNIQRNKDGHHNALFINSGGAGLRFDESAVSAGVDEGGWGWGTTFMDANNDGWLDLAETNGWNGANFPGDQSKLWINHDGESFEDVSEATKMNDELNATTLLSLDYDRDGDLDLLQTLKPNPEQATAVRILENTLSGENINYLVVKPRMMGQNHWSIGATVRITIDGIVQQRPITAGTSFYGQEAAEAHFGLGESSVVDEVEIIWPGGARSSRSSVETNQTITITDENTLHRPGTLVAKAIDESQIHLSWGQQRSIESGFLIERSTSESFNDFETIQIDEISLEYADTGLEPYSIYFYRIRSSHLDELSAPSNIALARTESDVWIEAPSSLSVQQLSTTVVLLQWEDNSENEESFAIQRSSSSDFDGSFDTSVSANTETYVVENLEPNHQYHFRIRAERIDGHSDFSEQVEITTSVVLDIPTNADLILYPNPVQHQLHIEGLQGDRRTTLILRDLLGREIKSWSHVGGKLLTIEIPPLYGIFNLTILEGGQIRAQKKVLIENK